MMGPLNDSNGFTLKSQDQHGVPVRCLVSVLGVFTAASLILLRRENAVRTGERTTKQKQTKPQNVTRAFVMNGRGAAGDLRPTSLPLINFPPPAAA